jgi:hypothetical protein
VVTSVLLAFLSKLGAVVPPQALQQGATDGIRVFGLVNSPLNLTYYELRSFPMVSEVAELKCVSGSPDVTYNWTGIPLFYLLTLAQAKPEAYKVATRASDGFSSDLLIEDALKPTTILALAANGTDLPEVNGIKGLYRLVVPCKWGYKWVGNLTEIEVVDYDYKGTYESNGQSDEADRPDCTVLPPITPPMQELNLASGNTTFNVEAFTNVSINDYALDYAQKKISLNITVPSGTVGFADFILPQTFLQGPYNVSVDTQTVNTIETDLAYQSYLYVTFPYGLHNVEITGTERARIHDVAVISARASSSKTVVCQTYNCSLKVIVSNQGDFTEAFNVTAYANTTVIGTQTVNNILNRTSMVLSFTWNTGGLAYGNWTLSAYVWPVPGETNTANNNYTGGWIVVTIPGDLNGDFKVSLSDLVLLANAYGSKPGDAKWNPNADINGNDKVDLSDLVLLASHYRQHYP